MCGYGQSRTIPYHLYYNPRVFRDDCVSSVLKFDPIFKTLIREDTPEVMVDKLALLDFLHSHHVQHPDLISTDLITNHFVRRLPSLDLDPTSDETPYLNRLYSNLVKNKYGKIMEEQKEKASNHLKEEVKRTVRDNWRMFKAL